MARLSTHILDTATGRPAAAVRIELFALDRGGRTLVTETVSNADGRTDQPLLSGETIPAGTYELVFHVGDYFARQPSPPPEPRFIDRVPVRFGIADPAGHYHVPLLASPWSYSTYRGS